MFSSLFTKEKKEWIFIGSLHHLFEKNDFANLSSKLNLS